MDFNFSYYYRQLMRESERPLWQARLKVTQVESYDVIKKPAPGLVTGFYSVIFLKIGLLVNYQVNTRKSRTQKIQLTDPAKTKKKEHMFIMQFR